MHSNSALDVDGLGLWKPCAGSTRRFAATSYAKHGQFVHVVEDMRKDRSPWTVCTPRSDTKEGK